MTLAYKYQALKSFIFKIAALSVLPAALLTATAGLAAGGDGEGGESSRLALFYSASLAGNFEPCGCSGNPTGGLARRAGVMTSYSDQHSHPILQVDAGNFFAALGPGSSMVNELMTEALREFPVSVLNLASEDLHYWDQLSALEDLPTQIISTNLTPRRSSRALPARYAVVEIEGSRLGLSRNLRIGFLGVTDPSRVKPNSGFRASNPMQAIAQVKDEVLKEADWLVVLADVEREAKTIATDSFFYRLAEAHPEVKLIIHTEKRYVLFPPEEAGSATVLGGVERGRQLARLLLTLDNQGGISDMEQEFFELKEGVPEDEQWLQRQARVKLFTQ
ncbi:MAG TPA: hypothetical protein VLU25_20340 [Acidobacteriota bacterium]|nr:hypothetical protein [Acidobacteriota bacterium]